MFNKTLQIIINIKSSVAISSSQQVLNEVGKDLKSSHVILVGMLRAISIFQSSYSLTDCFTSLCVTATPIQHIITPNIFSCGLLDRSPGGEGTLLSAVLSHTCGLRGSAGVMKQEGRAALGSARPWLHSEANLSAQR